MLKYYDTSEKDWDILYARGGWRGCGSGPGSLIKNNKYLIDYLSSLILEQKIRKIIDIGCGDCQWIFKCFDIEKATYLGVDFSKHVLSKNPRHNNISYMHDSIRNPEFSLSDSFDLLICKDLLHHNLFYAETIAENLKKIGATIKIIITPEKTNEKIMSYFQDYELVSIYLADERKKILYQKSLIGAKN